MVRVINHYARKIARAVETGDNDQICECLHKLLKLPITIKHLETTGIGRVVNKLRSRGGVVGKFAERVVLTWKYVVKTEITENYISEENCNS